jgi:hypothetical protein
MSLAAATVFALGLAGSAVAQTPAPPASAPTTAPAQPTPPAKGGGMQTDKGMQMEKKDKKASHKQHGKKKHAAAKKTEGDVKAAPATKAPEVKK